jgi:hypothetical protein
MRNLVHAALLSIVGVGSTFAADQPASRYSLSIYSAAANNGDSLFAPSEPEPGTPGGYAIVRDRRQFDLKAGSNTIQVNDVARYLDPGALSVRAVGEADGVDIISQRFEDETLSLDALVQAHIGHAVEVGVSNGASVGVFSGTLLSNSGGLTIQGTDGRITTLTDFNRVTFPDLPKGLAATASLRWEIAAKKAGAATFEIIYPTQGMAWRAEYSGGPSGAHLRFALVGMGADRQSRRHRFPRDARVKLIAGEPHRAAAAPAPPPGHARRRADGFQRIAGRRQRQCRRLSQYTLGNPVDLASGTLLRAALFPADDRASTSVRIRRLAPARRTRHGADLGTRLWQRRAPPPIRSTLAFKSNARCRPAACASWKQPATARRSLPARTISATHRAVNR